MGKHLNSDELITLAVIKGILHNWVYPQTEKTETALTWLQDYANNIQEGNSVSLTGDETKHKNEQI